MKLKIGLISNNSSTTFILYIPREITAEKFVKMIREKTAQKFSAGAEEEIIKLFGEVKKGTTIDATAFGGFENVPSDVLIENFNITSSGTGEIDQGFWLVNIEPGLKKKIEKIEGKCNI